MTEPVPDADTIKVQPAPNLNPPNPEVKLDVVKQFDVLAAQLRFEYTLIWTRLGFLFAIQGALLAVFIRTLEVEQKGNHDPLFAWYRWVLVILGLVLIVVFWWMKDVTEWWAAHWLRLLRHYEKLAYPDTPQPLFPEGKAAGNMKQFGEWVHWALGFVWVVLAVLLILQQQEAIARRPGGTG